MSSRLITVFLKAKHAMPRKDGRSDADKRSKAAGKQHDWSEAKTLVA
ncbi:MAG: hypothetical protein SPI30_07335 [Prevotella sp.]|nr:hypothetical protein [Prevotella sp.]